MKTERMYGVLILANLGKPADNFPWIPSLEEIDEFRRDMDFVLSLAYEIEEYVW